MKQNILTPLALILLGFFSLMLSIYVGGGLMILGIIMLVERIWPEKLNDGK